MEEEAEGSRPVECSSELKGDCVEGKGDVI